MKEFTKKYEDVFSRKKIKNILKIENIEPLNGMPLNEYIKTFTDTIEEYQAKTFDLWVKVYWLMINFSYGGMSKKGILPGGRRLEPLLTDFFRNYINFNRKMFTSGPYFTKVATYFCDFFPNFVVGNPFDQKYEYPYTYMTFDCLFLVYQMPDRLELLKIGEERAMGYSTFVDYIFNHVLCSNEESDTEEYKIMYPFNNLPPYIKYENYAANIRNRPKRKRRKKT